MWGRASFLLNLETPPVSEYIAVIAVILSAVGAIYSILSFKKRRDEVAEAYKRLIKSYSGIIGDISSSTTVDLLRARQDLEKVITGASESLSHITGKEIHSSIKLFGMDNEQLHVVTFLRDRASAPSRETFSLKYPVDQNTAYSHIFKNLDKDHFYFISNNIKKMEDGGYLYYGSTNDQWKDLYKSVLVVPIKGKSEEDLLGFLTFDSKDKSAFSKDNADLASSVSTLVAATLLKAFSSGKAEEHHEHEQNA